MESISLSSLPQYLQQAYHSLKDNPANNGNNAVEINVKSISQIRALNSPKERLFELLLRRHGLNEQIADFGKCYPPQILERAETYEALEYDDLATFDAYVVYILCQKELSDEFVTDLEAHSPEGEDWNSCSEDVIALKIKSLALLVRCLTRLGAIGDARTMRKELRELNRPAGEDAETSQDGSSNHLRWESVLRGADHDINDVQRTLETSPPSRFGASRREIYPWSTYEPDRNTPEAIADLNEYLSNIAPNLEAKLTALPAFDSSGHATGEISHQLGLFANIDLAPEQEILSEKSILTAIRPLEDALCDACGQDLEGISFDEVRQCDGEDCDITFCSQDCKDHAVRGYHCPNLENSEDEDEEEEDESPEPDEQDLTADVSRLNVTEDHGQEASNTHRVTDTKPTPTPFCGNQDLSLIGRPTNTSTPEWDLYFLLQTRAIAMSITQNTHPLNLPETKYLWADFNPSPFTTIFHISSSLSTSSDSPLALPIPIAPRTLPFSLTHTIIHPLDYLTTLSLTHPSATPYTSSHLKHFDSWILQTLHSKFRGVANATQSTFDGQPELAAVHAGWCLANHSCAPNVRWGGNGGVRRFWVRGDGVRAGEEIWSHYTDVRLGVGERTERLRGVLGGRCRCVRCLEEAGDES